MPKIDYAALQQDLKFHLRCMTPCLYVLTQEEDTVLNRIFQETKVKEETKRIQVHVYDPTTGLLPIKEYVADWSSRIHPEARETMGIHESLLKIYKDDTRESKHIYVMLDPERWFQDPHAVRRFLRILHQMTRNNTVCKQLIFVGSRKTIPEKLAPYMTIITADTITEAEYMVQLEPVRESSTVSMPTDYTLVEGLTTFGVRQLHSHSMVMTKMLNPNARDKIPSILNHDFATQFRRANLAKTDLVQYVDTKPFSFDQVGGADRFKAWVEDTKATWTPEGQAFGLKPPRGVLAVGVWGCGKSLSIKAMGQAWGLPVISLETGKLRSHGVGDTEANVYRAIKSIESIGDCLVWIDEAEKSLSGGASSNATDAGTTSRLIGIFSTWMQETNKKVCLALTANSLAGLPVEFVNRMDERFFFDVPDESARVEILKIHLKKAKQDPDKYDLARLSKLSDRMVGREIEQAIWASMTASFKAKKQGLDQDILSEMLRSKPRILKTMADEVQPILDWVGWDEESKDGIRARYATSRRGQTSRMMLRRAHAGSS